MEELQERPRSPQISQRQRVDGVVPSVGPELEAEARKRDIPKRLVVTLHKFVRSPRQARPQQSVAPAAVFDQQTLPPTTNSELAIVLPQVTPLSVQEETVRVALSSEREIEHGRVSVTDAAEAEHTDALPKNTKIWVCDCVRDYLLKHAHGRQVTFSTFLQPFGHHELEHAKFGKRSYLAIPLNSWVDDRLKNDLEEELVYLMEDWEDSERFEVRVFRAVRQEMKGGVGGEIGLLLDPHSMIRVESLACSLAPGVVKT